MNRLLSPTLPQQLYCPEQVREYESKAAELAGISMGQLMQRAGRAVFECLRETFPPPLKVTVLCGSGNNGGDGYIVATHASLAGYEVRVFAHGSPSTEDALRAQQGWHNQGGSTEILGDWLDSDADVVIDALLGTGLSRPVDGDIADAIESLNDARLPVIAIDVPSGLNADTGRVMGCAVQARHTVTMVALKRGLFTGEAGDRLGELLFADLGILREFRALTEASAWRLDVTQLSQALPKRPWNSHKGMFGHVLIIGGDEGMAGAVYLAAKAALRTGAGKVSVICAPDQSTLAGHQPEVMVRERNADDDDVDALIAQADVVAIGPGLGRCAWGRDWWHKLAEAEKPLIVDADALYFLAQTQQRRDDWVLTPHPGEAARLLNCSVTEVEENRWYSAALLQEQFGGTVVLKGAGSIICGEEYVAVNTSGNPGQASAGMGDTLTGIISALIAPLYTHAAQIRQSVAETTGYAVLIHGAAADQAASGTPRGLIATDVINSLRDVINPNG